MSVNPTMLLVAALGVAVAGPLRAQEPAPTGLTRPGTQTSDLAAALAGTWDLALDDRSAVCKLVLRGQKSDKGDYFLGMPPACRHAMPSLAKVGRWNLPDGAHVTLDEPSGNPVLTLAAADGGFAGTLGAQAFTLKRLESAAAAATPLDASARAAIVPVARHSASAPARPTTRPDRPADVAGRYAVMRETRDTGCMLTLDDMTRGKSGSDRAQLAPGCRDQGIVIFDPVGWRLVKGALVLTARAGHTTRLDKVDDGRWAKDTKDGGKPLGLKRL